MTLAVDPETGELVGPASAVQALLDGDEQPEDAELAAALAAAREPAFTVATIAPTPLRPCAGMAPGAC